MRGHMGWGRGCYEGERYRQSERERQDKERERERERERTCMSDILVQKLTETRTVDVV